MNPDLQKNPALLTSEPAARRRPRGKLARGSVKDVREPAVDPSDFVNLTISAAGYVPPMKKYLSDDTSQQSGNYQARRLSKTLEGTQGARRSSYKAAAPEKPQAQINLSSTIPTPQRAAEASNSKD